MTQASMLAEDTAVRKQPEYYGVNRADFLLMRRVAAKDEDAIAEFQYRFSGLIFRLSWFLTANRETAEDLMQETLLHFWRKAAEYDPEKASLGTFVILVTRKKALNHMRANRKENKTRALPPAIAAPAAPEFSSLDREDLLRAVSRLSPAQQQALQRILVHKDKQRPKVHSETRAKALAALSLALGREKSRR